MAKIDWVKIVIEGRGEGVFIGYDEVGDETCEGSWNKVRLWARDIIDTAGEEIRRRELAEEAPNG